MARLSLEDIDAKVNTATVEQLKSFLLESSTLWSGSFLALSSLLSCTDFVNPTLAAGLTGASLVSCFNSISGAYKDARKFAQTYRAQLLEQTDEYYECLEAYDRYIDKIVRFMRMVGVNDSVDVGMFYMQLLYKGLISAPGYFEYYRKTKELDYCPELWGARVATGQAVCRHIASNLVDVYNGLGFTAGYLSVRGVHNDSREVVANRALSLGSTHAVVSVGDTYGKFIVDPTWKTMALFSKDEVFAKVVFGSTTKSLYRVFYNQMVNKRTDINYDNYVSLRRMKNAILTKKELREAHEKAVDYFKSNPELMIEFSYYLHSDVQTVARLEKKLTSYSGSYVLRGEGTRVSK